tara:strand:- start:2481 stop:4172 length:1692 start_codon:yes stop_codon:yes gene_type:complete
MILTLVGVKNFKSFKETSWVNLGNKFTLLYGNNSSGKSSILQAIDILKSSFSSPGQGIKYEGTSGELNDFICKFGDKKFIEIFFDVKIDQALGMGIGSISNIAKALKFTHLRINLKIKLQKDYAIADKISFTGFKIEEMHQVFPLQHPVIDPGRDHFLFELSYEGKVSKKDIKKLILSPTSYALDDSDNVVSKYSVSKITEDEKIWRPWFEMSKGLTSKDIESYWRYSNRKNKENFIGTLNKIRKSSNIHINTFGIFKKFLINDIKKNMFFISAGVDFTLGGGGRYPGVLRRASSRSTFFEILDSIIMDLRFRRRTDPKRFELPFLRFYSLPGRLLNFAINSYVFRSIFYVHSSKSRFEDTYRMKQVPFYTVGKDGENTAFILMKKKQLLKSLNSILQKSLRMNLKLNSTYFQGQKVTTFRANDLMSSKKLDTVKMALAGKGFNSIIPYLTEILNHKNSMILLEEIENSLHPRVISPLLESLSSDKNNNRYIFETHSEPLVLKIQQLVKNKKLRPDDVAINYVQRTKKGSNITYIPLDPNGNFEQPWPDGFFPEKTNIILNKD